MLGLSVQLLRRSAGLTVTCFKNVKKREILMQGLSVQPLRRSAGLTVTCLKM